MTQTQAVPSTATAPVRRRGWIGWLVLAVLVIGGAVLMLRVADATSMTLRTGMDPENARDNGTMALAELLRDEGVEVQVARSRDEAAAAIGPDTTLVMRDPFPLDDESVLELVEPAHSLVLLSGGSRMMRLFDLGDRGVTAPAERVTAHCDLPELSRVGEIEHGTLYTPAPGVTGCFVNSHGDAAVLVDDRGDARRVLLDARALLTNEFLAENGNAALGLALLGQTDHVVWYMPTQADSDFEPVDDPATLGELTPGWLTPAIIMLILAGVVAAVWRGRRFGPLVAETLPVTVRASETMHGRARLTAKAADAGHAAAALRDGAARRLARRLGLHDRATPVEVADAAADRLRVPRASVQELLAGPPPVDDAELVDIARRLSDIEAAVDATVREERRAP